MFGSLGFTELILILFIVLIIFGAGKLPQLGEGFGKAIKGFKKSVHEADTIEAEAQAQAQQASRPRHRLSRCRLQPIDGDADGGADRLRQHHRPHTRNSFDINGLSTERISQILWKLNFS